ncbi:uncharacterized protein LOC125939827 [Dermacentor silvarum]|uniref:uncharacterized protein LOC125939827 n=1 Tax=Dermacentor silvarum TaxID=543639 RepID=UPI0021014A31|nr:uncharacterized protein LOC125939827 [Dermacentor silvarum]
MLIRTLGKFEAVTLLEEVNALRLYMPLALSLSLAGRYYEPNFTDPVSPVDEEFALFKPCQDFNTSRYGDPVSVVCESADTDWKFENITKHNYAYAFSKSERRTLTYDTKDTLTKKASKNERIQKTEYVQIVVWNIEDSEQIRKGKPPIQFSSAKLTL